MAKAGEAREVGDGFKAQKGGKGQKQAREEKGQKASEGEKAFSAFWAFKALGLRVFGVEPFGLLGPLRPNRAWKEELLAKAHSYKLNLYLSD